MITLTAAAAADLRSLLKHGRARPGQGVTVSPNGHGGLILGIGAGAAGDTVVCDGDVPLLIVAQRIAGVLDGLVFDCPLREVDGRSGRHLTFRRPDRASEGQ